MPDDRTDVETRHVAAFDVLRIESLSGRLTVATCLLKEGSIGSNKDVLRKPAAHYRIVCRYALGSAL